MSDERHRVGQPLPFGIPALGHLCSMQVAGVDMPPSSVAQLAVFLSRAGHEELAMRVGLAVDINKPILSLSALERTQIRQQLAQDCPTALLPLRDALA